MKAERFLVRDRHYGVWHRAPSIGRFLGCRRAAMLTTADLDSVLFAEYDYVGKMPLCLVEVARDIGQTTKPAGVIRQLARLSNIPAFVALYSLADAANPANDNWCDIDGFRVQRLWPKPEHGWRQLTPAQWASALWRIREWQLRRFDGIQAANDEQF